METIELEQMTLEELAFIKGGIWIEINGELIWVEERSILLNTHIKA